MSASNNKASSLKWAIEELSKQRDDLDAKLKVAHKRDETNALIDEVFAQKKALELRISALEDGLRVSTELVETTSSELESEMSKIDEKLDIAKERLHALQQRLQLGTLEQLAKKGAAGSQALVSKIEALLCVLCEPELVEGAVSAAVWRDVAHNQVGWASESSDRLSIF